MRRGLVVLLLLTACGGGGESAKDAYLDKAEAVCARGNEQLDAAQKSRPTATAGLVDYVQKLVTIARDNVEALRALEPPAEDRAAIEEKVLRPLQEQLAAGEQYRDDVAKAVAAKDNAALFKLIANPPTDTRADVAFMREYGFEACVKAADTARAGS